MLSNLITFPSIQPELSCYVTRSKLRYPAMKLENSFKYFESVFSIFDKKMKFSSYPRTCRSKQSDQWLQLMSLKLVLNWNKKCFLSDNNNKKYIAYAL